MCLVSEKKKPFEGVLKWSHYRKTHSCNTEPILHSDTHRTSWKRPAASYSPMSTGKKMLGAVRSVGPTAKVDRTRSQRPYTPKTGNDKVSLMRFSCKSGSVAIWKPSRFLSRIKVASFMIAGISSPSAEGKPNTRDCRGWNCCLQHIKHPCVSSTGGGNVEPGVCALMVVVLMGVVPACGYKSRLLLGAAANADRRLGSPKVRVCDAINDNGFEERVTRSDFAHLQGDTKNVYEMLLSKEMGSGACWWGRHGR